MDRWKATALVLAGILVGVVFAGPRVTGADEHQAKGFKECAVFCPRGRVVVVKPSKLPDIAMQVPQGWTAVGPGGGDGGCMFLCR